MDVARAWAVIVQVFFALAQVFLPAQEVATDHPGRLFAPYAPAYAEPAPAATFMAAYSAGDVAALEQLGSPLYRLEAGRYTNPLAPFPWAKAYGDAATPAPRYTYVDGLVDRAGFAHLLYVASPAGSVEDEPFVSAWRVDVAPDGRVAWVEMVRVLGHVSRLAAVRTTAVDPRLLAVVPAPRRLAATWTSLRPRILVGVEAAEGERYYLLGLDRNADAAAATATPAIVTHFSLDPAGVAYLGWWSFGRPMFAYVDGEPMVTRTSVPSDLRPQLRAYLATLWD